MAIQEATSISLSVRERAVLESWSRTRPEMPRQAERARIVLMAAEGVGTRRIAHVVGCTIGTASKWRVRFARDRLEGLSDRPRPGAKPRYDQQTDRRILALLDTPPPEGRRMWTGALLADALGDVSDQYIWRFLRLQGIGQGDRRTWHFNVGAPFRGRAVDIVALYLHPIECAVIFSAHRGAPVAGSGEGYVRVPRGGIPPGVRPGQTYQGGSALLAALNAAGNAAAPRGEEYDPVFSLRQLADVTADAFSGRRLVVAATMDAAAGNALPTRPDLHVTLTPDRESWLGQFGIILTLLIGPENDPNARLRAAELADAARRFLGRVEQNDLPFIWGRKNTDVSTG